MNRLIRVAPLISLVRYGVQVSNRIEVPEVCPSCGAQLCVEWDCIDPTLSRLHCRAQHANENMCDFSIVLDVEPGQDRYVIVTKDARVTVGTVS